MGMGFQLPVGMQLKALFIKPAAAAGTHLFNSLKNTTAGRPARSHQHDLRHTVLIQPRRNQRMHQQRLDLGTKNQGILPEGKKERLDPHPVPGQKELLLPVIPDGKGKDAVTPPETVLSPLNKGVKHHLGITVGAKLPAQLFQLSPQFSAVIELSVVDNGEGRLSFPPGHGLTAALRINYSEAGMEKDPPFQRQHSLLIRPPPLHGGQHPIDPWARLKGLGQLYHACNGAHGHHPLPGFSICLPQAAGAGFRDFWRQ